MKNNKSTVYCHFSFKRPKGKDYGLFAVAMYRDFDGKKLITDKTRRIKLWEDHQFITAVQAYENALHSIYEWQGLMSEANINQIMLVTDNSTLAGWIENPKKNKAYYGYMEKAVKMYRAGAPKEIVLGIGLCEPREYEKSYKYCKEERVVEDEKVVTDNRIDITKIAGVQSVMDILENDESIPEISGIKQLTV